MSSFTLYMSYTAAGQGLKPQTQCGSASPSLCQQEAGLGAEHNCNPDTVNQKAGVLTGV